MAFSLFDKPYLNRVSPNTKASFYLPMIKRYQYITLAIFIMPTSFDVFTADTDLCYGGNLSMVISDLLMLFNKDSLCRINLTLSRIASNHECMSHNKTISQQMVIVSVLTNKICDPMFMQIMHKS